MAKSMGSYAFIVGVIIAIVLGILSGKLGDQTAAILSSILILMGIVVGFMNVTDKEAKEYLLTVAVLIVAVGLGGQASNLANIQMWDIGLYLNGVFSQLLAFIVPATIVVALKQVHQLAQD